jgi:hypothetical protein
MSLLIRTKTGFHTFQGKTLCRDQAPESDIELNARGIQRLAGDNRWRAIVCQHGRVWITQKHDLKDYVLSAGEVFLITNPGTVIVQALEAARVEITPSLAGASCAKRFADTVFP